MKITKRQEYWLEIIKKCGGVFKYYNSLGTESFQILNSKEEIDKKMVERLIKKGALVGAGDGMFGDHQLYRAIEG